MLFYYKSKERPQQRQVQPAGLLYSRENTYETETLALQMSKDIETAFGKEGSLLRKKPLIKDTFKGFANRSIAIGTLMYTPDFRKIARVVGQIYLAYGYQTSRRNSI